MQKGTKDGLTYASHLFEEISGWKNADELEQNSLKKIKDIESERIYREASEKMEEGNVKGLTEALGLFSQIPGWRDADDLAAECKKKLRDLRQKKMLRYIPYLAAVSAGVLFILIGSHTGIPSGKVITVSPTAEAVLPEIPGSADGSFPTLPPVPTGTPADTAVPEAVPTAVTTDTPVPASTENPTETPFPTATPTKTKTPSPTATSTKTETPVPTATATKTKTPVPTATATPTKTLTPAEINERIQLLLQGESAFKNGNYSSAFRYMISAADMGDENAQIYVGYMYERGTGTEQSYEKAAEYYRMAADQNNVTALYNLGVFYENGLGVERSYEKAAEYYRMAADQKFAAAENNLGVMYERGSGVEQSYEKAAEYYRRAA
ncbi:MAG: SEL1-like repeat protein, partial [Anaerolineaceae bacterium]|nr:SEL1-like repeat protein [Anaerolineaceae bacterium]